MNCTKRIKGCATGAAVFLLLYCYGLAGQQAARHHDPCACDPYQRLAERQYAAEVLEKKGAVATGKVPKARRTFRTARKRRPEWRLKHISSRIERCYLFGRKR